jgi:hypothetical protein
MGTIVLSGFASASGVPSVPNRAIRAAGGGSRRRTADNNVCNLFDGRRLDAVLEEVSRYGQQRPNRW